MYFFFNKIQIKKKFSPPPHKKFSLIFNGVYEIKLQPLI